jgi:hypothetical protein
MQQLNVQLLSDVETIYLQNVQTHADWTILNAV